MDIVIISDTASFPGGMAASSRVHLIAKGLSHNKNVVTYIGMRGANTSLSINKKKGVFDGIKYYYPGFFGVRSQNWILRRIDDFTGVWMSIIFMFWKKKRHNIDLIILYTRNYNVVKIWEKVARILKIKILLELCEWPIVKEIDITNNARIFCEKAPIIVDGVLPISEYITNEIYKLSIKHNINIPIFPLPILIDADKFNVSGFSTNKEDSYLLYSGSIQYIEIAKLVIDSIILLKNDGTDVQLKFTGGGSKKMFDYIVNYIKDNCVDDRISFTGYLDEHKLIELMKNAKVLLAPIPNNSQTKARFPTKIGYYLASGRPLITNSYGEVNKYLINNKNAFLMDDFTAEALKGKIIEVMNNPQKCEQIGIHGKNLAHEMFHYKNHFQAFNAFIEKISK